LAGENRNSASLSLVGIYEISKILSSAVNLRASLRAVLNLMSSYLDMRRGVVAIVDAEGSFDVVAAAGATPREIAEGGVSLPEQVAGAILAGQMPFVTENVAEHPLLADYLGDAGTLDDERVSFIGVPIKTVGRPFGVLAVARMWSDKLEVSFGDDVRFLTMVANLIAQTVKLHQKHGDASRPPAGEENGGANGTEGANGAGKGRRPPRRANLDIPAEFGHVIGSSRAMQEVFAQVHLVAPTRSTVLVRGESGTGKELIARAVHMLSPRKDAPFIKVNCAALPDSLLESELFGHEKGAFTGATSDRKGRFELADGGTLFLDEIGDVSPAFQAKLLRVLQEKEFERVGGSKTIKVNVRLVGATNRNLEEMVAKGDFRADLYYRINVVPVFVPSLRERREDIPLLAEHFLKLFNEENDRSLSFSQDATRVLRACTFPGNVRELENCVYRVATMTKGDLIEEIDVPCQTNRCHCLVLNPEGSFGPGVAIAPGPTFVATVPPPQVPPPGAAAPPAPGLGERTAPPMADWQDEDDLTDLDALPQRERLIRVMEKTGWVQAKAARMLGITPRQVGYALRKYNIEIKRI
jgi:Nif-specific regulatory protein